MKKVPRLPDTIDECHAMIINLTKKIQQLQNKLNTNDISCIDDNTKRFGYTSTLERENGKKYAGTLLLDIELI